MLVLAGEDASLLLAVVGARSSGSVSWGSRVPLVEETHGVLRLLVSVEDC